MTNVNISNKSTDDQHTAAEFNLVKNWINAPLAALGAFNPATPVSVDGSGEFDEYTVAANLTIQVQDGVAGNYVIIPLVFDGTDTLTIENTDSPSKKINIQDSSFTNKSAPAAGSYDLYIAYSGGKYKVNLVYQTEIATDETPPTITSQVVENAGPNELVVAFDEIVTTSGVAGYTFRVDSVNRTLSAVSGSGTNTLTFTISGAAITNGQVLDLSYDQGTGDTEDGAGNELAAFTQTSVTNNVGATTPLDLLGADLLLWLHDPDNTTTITGSGVSNWADQTANGRDLLQSTDAARPTVVSSEVVFDGVDDVLSLTPITGLDNASGCITFIVDSTMLGGNNWAVFTDTAVANEYFLGGANGTNQPHIVNRISSETTNIMVFSGTLSAGDIVTFYSTGTAYGCVVNGVARSQDSGPTTGDWIGDNTSIDRLNLARLRNLSSVYYNVSGINLLIHNYNSVAEIQDLHNIL